MDETKQKTRESGKNEARRSPSQGGRALIFFFVSAIAVVVRNVGITRGVSQRYASSGSDAVAFGPDFRNLDPLTSKPLSVEVQVTTATVSVPAGDEQFVPVVNNGTVVAKAIEREKAHGRNTSVSEATPLNRAKRVDLSAKADQGQPTKVQKPLNILVLYPDDWRHDSIGGVVPVLRTPFLNKLASKGIRFTHNCVTTSICWISRATYFTGQYASRHKSDRLKNPYFYNYWNETWPALLQAAGYYTGHVGKWQYYGLREEFFNYTFQIEGHHWYKDKSYKSRKVHGSDYAKDKAILFLKDRPKDQPFALNVAFYPPKAVGESSEPGAQWSPKPESMALYANDTIPKPHGSWEKLPWFFQEREKMARTRWRQRFDGDEKYQVSMKNYYRLITEVDAAIEKIVDELNVQGVLNETMIIFTCDNGFFHGEHGLAGKWYPYQESIRVPLIIHDPRMPEAKRNTLDDSYTLNIDLAPTILGAAGLSPPPRMQGRDISDLYLSPSTTEAQPWRTEFYYEWKLNNGMYFPKATALVRKDFKYIYWPQYKHEQLFDLINDELENNDLVNETQYQKILADMRERHNELEPTVA